MYLKLLTPRTKATSASTEENRDERKTLKKHSMQSAIALHDKHRYDCKVIYIQMYIERDI